MALYNLIAYQTKPSRNRHGSNVVFFFDWKALYPKCECWTRHPRWTVTKSFLRPFRCAECGTKAAK